jgi:hypothetical protein
VDFVAEALKQRPAGAYTRPRSGSTQAQFMGNVGCMIYTSLLDRGTRGGVTDTA